MTNVAQPLTAAQIQSVQTGLAGWNWINPILLANGINTESAPASESSNKRNGIIRPVAVHDQTTGVFTHLNFLISLRAGWSLEHDANGKVVCPSAMMNAAGNNREEYLKLKNVHQITLTINPTLPKMAEVLDHLLPNWREVRQPGGDGFPIPPSTMRIIGLRFVPNRDGSGRAAQTGRGSYLYNFDSLEIVDRAQLYEEYDWNRPAQGARFNTEALQQQFGGQLIAPTVPNAGSPNVAVPQSRAAVPAGTPASPDQNIINALTAAGDFPGLSKYLASF